MLKQNELDEFVKRFTNNIPEAISEATSLNFEESVLNL